MARPKLNPSFFFPVKKQPITRLICFASYFVALTTPMEQLFAQTTNAVAAAPGIRVAGIVGKVEIVRKGEQLTLKAWTEVFLENYSKPPLRAAKTHNAGLCVPAERAGEPAAVPGEADRTTDDRS
jgi:hypothetical protein